MSILCNPLGSKGQDLALPCAELVELDHAQSAMHAASSCSVHEVTMQTRHCPASRTGTFPRPIILCQCAFCRREGIPIELALMGSADKRFSAGLRAPLFAAVHSHTPCFEWLDEAQVDISAPLLQVCYLQVGSQPLCHGAACEQTMKSVDQDSSAHHEKHLKLPVICA